MIWVIWKVKSIKVVKVNLKIIILQKMVKNHHSMMKDRKVSLVKKIILMLQSTLKAKDMKALIPKVMKETWDIWSIKMERMIQSLLMGES